MKRRSIFVLLGLMGLALAAWALSQQEPPSPDRIARYKAEVSALRGLEFPKPVEADVITPEEFRALLRRELDRELPEEKARQVARAYAKFGVIPKDLDLREALVELLSDATAAFYDPRTKDLKVLKSEEGARAAEAESLRKAGLDLEGAVLVHELTHAAQDQAFDLSTLPLDTGDDDDLSLALKAVVEGDASAVGWKYAFRENFDSVIGLINQVYKSGELPGKAGKLPAYLRFSLTFPYGYGTDFVMAVVKAKGGSLRAISSLFQDMPLSSEQILHPEKYLGKRDDPVRVTLPDLPKLLGPAWKETFQNVHGEYSIRLILNEFLGPALTASVARAAAEGWGGDRYSVLESGQGRTAYVWYTTWDTERDAVEFLEAYARALGRKYGRPSDDAKDGSPTAYETPEGWVRLERRGSDVLVFDGVTEDVLAKADAVWAGTVKAERKTFERVPPNPGPVREKRAR